MSFDDEKAFYERAKQIAAANHISEELAGEYLSLVGDTPAVVRWEDDGPIVSVCDERTGAEIAQIKLPA